MQKEDGKIDTMANLVICTHSDLADGFVKAAKMIIPTLKNVKSVCFENGCSIDTLIIRIDEAVSEYREAKKDYIILTDMAGASPFNAALQVAIKDEAFVVGGINLPLILELAMLEEDFDEVNLKAIVNMANDSIKLIDSKILKC